MHIYGDNRPAKVHRLVSKTAGVLLSDVTIKAIESRVGTRQLLLQV